MTESREERRLSFIDCSVEQIQTAITTEWCDWKFNRDFWTTILTGEAAPEFRLVGNRTLEFWIRCYNRWQVLGQRLKSKAPGKVDGLELEQILSCPRHRLKDICKLFDHQGWKRLETEGMSGPALGKIKVPVVSLFTAGVLLSQLIAPKDKLRFIFGLADQDDSHTLDEFQFVNFITAFVRGLGSAFGIVNKDSMPSLEVIRELGRRLYDRISVIAAERLKSMSQHDDKTRAMLIQAIKDRQKKLERVTSLDLDEVEGGMPKYGDNVPLRQVLNYKTVEAWCFREFKDPLALPYALAIERFCSRGSGADLYHLKSEEWFLSHTRPVEIPQEELDASRDVKLPDRWQVLFIRDIYELCIEEGSFQLSFSECEYGLKRSLTLDLWELVADAMHKVVDGLGGTPTFLQFLKKAFPGAQPKHLSTFENWCEQYDDLQKRSVEMDLLTEAADIFARKNAMPVLPQDDQVRLEKEFEEMDEDGTGCVPVSTIEQRWGWDTETCRGIMAKWDLTDDGCLDKGDFLRMMCPDGYRLPSMQGEDRDVFGMLLTGSIRYLSDAISNEEDLFAMSDRRTSQSGRKLKPMPFSLLPEIPDSMWNYWNDLFTRLDSDEDDHVGERDLLREGLLSQEVARRLMQIIDPEHPESFTRRGFLTACLKASNMRRAKFECGR